MIAVYRKVASSVIYLKNGENFDNIYGDIFLKRSLHFCTVLYIFCSFHISTENACIEMCVNLNTLLADNFHATDIMLKI